MSLLEKQVAESLISDGMLDKFLEMSEQERIETIRAYIPSEVKKFERFQSAYITNHQAKDAFNHHILSTI